MKNDFLIKIIGVLGILLLISLFFNIRSASMTGITGSAIQEKVIICNENYMRYGEGCCLDLDKNLICDEDEKIVKDSEREKGLLNQIQELENKIKVLEEEKDLEEETCPVVCAEDEICVPVNKADGSVKWLCVDNPEQILGSGVS